MNIGTLMKIIVLIVVSALLASILNGFEYILLVAAAAMIHESGHIIAAKALGVPSCGGGSSIFGLSLKYDFSSVSYLREVAVSAAGALFNIIACAVTLLTARAPGTYAIFFVFSNLSLALFNLIPISPLDGAGILGALISIVAPPRISARISAWVSAAFSFLFFVFCIYVQLKVGANLSLMFISVFLLYNGMNGVKRIKEEP